MEKNALNFNNFENDLSGTAEAVQNWVRKHYIGWVTEYIGNLVLNMKLFKNIHEITSGKNVLVLAKKGFKNIFTLF